MQVTIGFDPMTGKQKRKSFYGRTRREAAEKAVRAQQEINTRTYVEPSRAAIKPALGRVPMARLQTHMIQSLYAEKRESGLSASTIKQMHTIIKQALGQAVKERLLPYNAADAASPPAKKAKKVHPLDWEKLDALFSVLKGDRLYPAYLLALTTGLRRGELLGLCWDCVDLDKGAITVKRQLVPLNKGPELQDATKTKSSGRTVTLTAEAARELKAWKKRQAQEKLLAGELWEENNLVFCREDGSPLRPEEFTKRFQRLAGRAGLSGVRLHDLRHTHASLLIAEGVNPKVIQERLGHNSITTTLDLYGHLLPGLDGAAAEALEGLAEKVREKAKKKAPSRGDN